MSGLGAPGGLVASEERIQQHWRRCRHCRAELRDGARHLTCPVYARLTDRPVPAEPIDLAPVTPKLLDAWDEQPISLEEAEENLGRGLRNAFWIAVGFWMGVLAVVLICWS
jgi:hypothetical protein